MAVLYLGASTGATVQVHYCMGKMVSMQFGKKLQKKCGKCGDKDPKSCAKDCCKDEHKLVKLEKDQKISENTMHFAKNAILTPVFCVETPKVHIVSATQDYPKNNAPPRSNKIPTFIQNCAFLI